MRNLKPLLPYLARHRVSLLLGLLILSLSAGLALTQPYLLRLGIDSLHVGKFEPLVSLAIVGVGLVQFGLGFLQRWAINRSGHQIEATIRSDLFAKTQMLDRSFFDKTSVGDLIVHSTSDISIQRNFIVQATNGAFSALFLSSTALVLMFLQNWRLALVGLVFLPFLVIAFGWVSNRMKVHYRAAQEQLGEVSNHAQEVFSGIRVVKAYTREDAETEHYASENEKYVDNTLKYARLNSLLLPLITLVIGLNTVVLLWVGANEIQAGRLTIGQFVQFNAYLLLLATPLSNLGLVVALSQQAATSMSRLQEIFRLQSKITDPDETERQDLAAKRFPRGSLAFNKVSLRFNDHRVLHEVSFEVKTGQTVAVVGPTGSGKSSLAALVGRAYDPDEGSVTLDGVDVRNLPLAELRREIAYVPQETLLFSLSLRENIALGKSEADGEEVLKAARLSRLSQDLPQIPGGFDAVVGERGVTLSGGQKQRTAIARALLPDASVLILDDALSSVDARTQNLIANNLGLGSIQRQDKRVLEAGLVALEAERWTRLIVTQRLALVQKADWIVVLDEGRVVAQGQHNQLIAQDGLYARMYQRELAQGQNNFLDDDLARAEAATMSTAVDETPAPATPGKSKDKQAEASKQAGDEFDEIVGNYRGGRLSRLLTYVKRYWRTMLLALPVIVAAALLELAGPLLSKIAIDNYITPGKLDGLGLILALFGLATLASFGLRYLRAYLMQKVGQYVVRDLRVKLFDHLLHNSLAFFDRYPAGSLIGRLTSDMDAISDLLSQGAVAIVADLVTLTAILVTMFLLDWRLALVSLAVLPILSGVSLFFRRIMRRAWRSSRRKYSVLVGYMAENYAGMLTVQLFNRQAVNFARFEELNQDYYRSNRDIVTTNGVFLPLVTFLASSANALLLLVGGWLFIETGNITFGLLVAFLQYTERAFQPIRDLAERYTIFQAASTSSERIFGLLDQKSQVLDPPEPKSFNDYKAGGHTPSAWSEVRFEEVSFGYDPQFPVIKNMSFTVRAGEKVAIVGPTGAGKTSIVSLLGRNYDIQSGQISLGGLDIREVTQRDLRQHLALVLQDPVLFKGTIADNIRLGNPNLSAEAMRQAAHEVGVDSFIEQLPGGYDYPLQERGSNISVGQRQLISFARAIAYNPEAILILDEATSSVDTESEAIIQEALQKLLENRTALIIAHRLSTIRDVDRVIVVERGRVVEMGTQSELIERRGIYYQLYRNQVALVNH